MCCPDPLSEWGRILGKYRGRINWGDILQVGRLQPPDDNHVPASIDVHREARSITLYGCSYGGCKTCVAACRALLVSAVGSVTRLGGVAFKARILCWRSATLPAGSLSADCAEKKALQLGSPNPSSTMCGSLAEPVEEPQSFVGTFQLPIEVLH